MTCSVAIHISGEFQSISRPPSPGPNYPGLQSSSGVHHSVGDFRSTEIERDLGDSGTWVVLTIARSIFLESFRSFGDLLHQGQTS